MNTIKLHYLQPIKLFIAIYDNKMQEMHSKNPIPFTFGVGFGK